MKFFTLVVGFIAVATTTSVFSKDDEVQCKKMVDAYIEGVKFIQNGSVQNPVVAKIESMRNQKASECDIQQSLIGTRAQQNEKK